MRKVKVCCTYTVEIEVSDEEYADRDGLTFRIEENGCPGTGLVGAAFDKVYEEAQAESVCWACNLQGENVILWEEGAGQ